MVYLGMKKITLSLFVLFIYASLFSQQKFAITDSFHIKSGGGWDYIAVGPGNNRLYVSHATQVNILDQTTGDSVGVIENTTGVHGIAFDTHQNKGFTSNGRLNNVTVFDLATNKVLGSVSTGTNPDAILYEPYLKKIITCNGHSSNISIIDPVAGKLEDSVAVGGKPETAVADGNGNLFVNIEDKNEIAVVDLKTKKVKAHWSLLPAEEPTGLCYDAVNKRLFAACGNKLLAIVNATNGKLITTLPIGDGCDGDAFDSIHKNIYTSNGEGTLTVYHQLSADKYVLLQNLKTKKGARTIAIDSKKHTVYLPAAEYQPGDNSERPKMIPGTFQILVISEK